MNLLEILGRIGFDWQVALANLVNFLIIFWLLKKFVFAPMQEKIAERQRQVQEGVKKNMMAEKELESAREEAQGIIEEAKSESRKIVESARQEKSAILVDAKAEAQTEAEKIIEEATRDMDMARQRQEKEFENYAVDLVTMSVRNILEEEVDEDKSRRIVNQILENK